ncbi:hypothetical protein M5689_008474 [Euphorbia peplus]|nr:hypothetical protein M5689_008474 [Euphorbia peplus]
MYETEPQDSITYAHRSYPVTSGCWSSPPGDPNDKWQKRDEDESDVDFHSKTGACRKKRREKKKACSEEWKDHHQGKKEKERKSWHCINKWQLHTNT